MKPLVSVVIPTHDRIMKLKRLLFSILNSDYGNVEIIVVDDASSDGTSEVVLKDFPSVKIIRNERNLLLAGSRNAGIRESKGSFIFVVDDDNVVAKDAISILVSRMEDDAIGIVAPVMYYFSSPKRVWCAGVSRNMLTSRTWLRKELSGSLVDSADCPNAFLLRRSVISKVGYFDEVNFPIHYDEADYGERVRAAGFRVCFSTDASVWHDISLPEIVEDQARLFHVHNPYRSFYAARNRVLFHRKYSSIFQFLAFFLFFNWLVSAYYIKVILFGSRIPFYERLRNAASYLAGIWKGII